MPDPQSTADLAHELPDDDLPIEQRIIPPADLAATRQAADSEPLMSPTMAAQYRIAGSIDTIRADLEILHSHGLDPRCKSIALTKLEEMMLWVENGYGGLS